MYYFSKLADSQARLPRLDKSLPPLRRIKSQRIRKKPKRFQMLPALGEPVVMRYNKKALFDQDREDLTVSAYKKYKPEGTGENWGELRLFGRKKPMSYLLENERRGRRIKF